MRKEREIEAKDINRALKTAAIRENRLNRALGLSYLIVKKGNLYEVYPDGTSRYIRPAMFGSIKVEKKIIHLKPKNDR